jgi:SulP family sulfate permease
MKLSRWAPASARILRDYSLSTFAHDLGAGVTVGLVALPLAMAFAIASGLTPQAGIYCAIITGFLISLLGGSRYQIGGPTGAFVVVVAGIVTEFGVSGLYMVTMMAGVMLVILGATGMGTAVKYLPRPVVIGFTNGIAVLIASTQIQDFFGLQLANAPSAFVARMQALAAAAGSVSWQATALGMASLGTILLLRRAMPRVPGAIVALVGGTAAAALLGLDLDTIGSRFGGIPAGLPAAHIPVFQGALIPVLIRPALTVAMLARSNRSCRQS